MAEDITDKNVQESNTVATCSECEGKGEVVCPECEGSGACCTTSSEPLTMDSRFILKSVIEPPEKKSLGYPFCYFGKCSACKGQGAKFIALCTICNGTGKCPICGGENVCRTCEGEKKIKCGICDGTGFKVYEGE